MDKYCADCVHNEVCRYEAYCSSGHCNDKETIDDLRPQGEWISDWRDDLDAMSRRGWKCSCCSWRTSYGTPNFCMNCGADMRKGGAV